MDTASIADDITTELSNRSISNLTENMTQHLLPISALTDAPVVGWLVFATVVSIVGNAAIVWIVVATPTLRSTPHNRLVVQLAICDLLTAVANAPPIAAAMMVGRWTLGDASCQLHGASMTLFGVASVITLSVISLNRCYMIAYTVKGYKLFTLRRTNILIGAIWSISITCSFPPIVGWSKYEFITTKAMCTIRWSTSPSYTLAVLGLGVFIPFVVMIGAYFRIFKKVRETNQRVSNIVVGRAAVNAINRRLTIANADCVQQTCHLTDPSYTFSDLRYNHQATSPAVFDGVVMAPTLVSMPRLTSSSVQSSATTSWYLATSTAAAAVTFRQQTTNRRPSRASCSLTGIVVGTACGERQPDQAMASCSAGGGNAGTVFWTSRTTAGLATDEQQFERRSLSNIQDWSTGGSESTTINEQSSTKVCRLAIPTSTTSATIGSGPLSSSTTTSSDPRVLVTPTSLLSPQSGVHLPMHNQANLSPCGLLQSCAWPGEVGIDQHGTRNKTSTILKDPDAASIDAVIVNKRAISFGTTSTVVDPSTTVGNRTYRSGSVIETSTYPSRVYGRPSTQTTDTPSVATCSSDLTSFSASGTHRVRTRRESRTSGHSSCGGRRLSLMQPSSVSTSSSGTILHAASTRHHKIGDSSAPRRTSRLAVDAAAVAERRSVELRQHIERSRRSRLRDELKVSLALLIVIVLFVVSWAPISFVNLLEIVGVVKQAVVSIDHAAVGMMFLQPALNPVIYGVMNRNFRDCFSKYICFGGCYSRAKKLQRRVLCE